MVQVAEAAGVSRTAVHKRVRRFRVEGQPGLQDRSSRPKRRRGASRRPGRRTLRLRRGLKRGPHRLAPLVGPSPLDRLRRAAAPSRLVQGIEDAIAKGRGAGAAARRLDNGQQPAIAPPLEEIARVSPPTPSRRRPLDMSGYPSYTHP